MKVVENPSYKESVDGRRIKGKTVELEDGTQQFVPNKNNENLKKGKLPGKTRKQSEKYIAPETDEENQLKTRKCEVCSTDDICAPRILRICRGCLDSLVRKMGVEDMTIKPVSNYGNTCHMCSGEEKRCYIWNPYICCLGSNSCNQRLARRFQKDKQLRTI